MDDINRIEPALDAASQLEQVCRLVQGLCRLDELHPAQWSALRYLARAEKTERTTNMLAVHQGTNPGTASRTISALMRKGLVTSTVSRADRRIRTISLTAAGRDLLMQDPLHRVAIGLQRLPRDTREQLPELLHELHRALSEQVRRPAIG
ncbi:MarR family winged helix-turn-helix transcriptional regulator [Marinibaculum pumilum]|uniref:MarR family winged helix-turn-helix transcriptional regulator n=1 Tax=Marinibaculum pumilum TaxID=1766165 RepID=A0ABV7L909_9PROT